MQIFVAFLVYLDDLVNFYDSHISLWAISQFSLLSVFLLSTSHSSSPSSRPLTFSLRYYSCSCFWNCFRNRTHGLGPRSRIIFTPWRNRVRYISYTVILNTEFIYGFKIVPIFFSINRWIKKCRHNFLFLSWSILNLLSLPLNLPLPLPIPLLPLTVRRPEGKDFAFIEFSCPNAARVAIESCSGAISQPTLTLCSLVCQSLFVSLTLSLL